jgi:hypothetical protein
VPAPEGVEKRLVGSNDFFEALKVKRPVSVKGLVPGEQEDAKTIGDVGRATPKMVDEKGCRLIHRVSSLVLLKRHVALAKFFGRERVHLGHERRLPFLSATDGPALWGRGESDFPRTTFSRTAARRMRTSAWSKVTNCFMRRNSAMRKDVRPQPHLFIAAKNLESSCMTMAPDHM